MKIIIEYNPSTGELINPKDGVNFGTWLGLDYVEHTEPKIEGFSSIQGFSSKVSISELKDLKDAGYTAYEIAELRASGVL